MAAPEGQIEAAFFDGQSARRHTVRIAPSQDGLSLVILREGEGPLMWPFDRLRALADQSDKTHLTLTILADSGDETPRDPTRLVVTDPVAVDWLLRTRPGLMRRDVQPGTLRKVSLWLGGALAAVALMLLVILPGLANIMADRLPPEAEAAMGRTVMKQIGWMLSDDDDDGLLRTCDAPEGLAALEQMKARILGDRDLPYDLQLQVFDHKMVNAFAAPGGQIVILRGLLDEAATADEVAGVLAHEIGHVAARDPVRLTLRSAGSAGILSLLFGDVTGGTAIAFAGDYLLQASYTRDAEAAADAYGFGLLNEAQLTTDAMAGFFDRIAGDTDVVPEYLSSHPLSTDRAEAARANAAAQGDVTPVLTTEEWDALRKICAK